jgi:hypothetical protein
MQDSTGVRAAVDIIPQENRRSRAWQHEPAIICDDFSKIAQQICASVDITNNV